MQFHIPGMAWGGLIFGALVLGPSSFANDGGLSLGGTPELLRGHPSVQMVSEKIRLTVGEKTVSVECEFIFANHGPACTVRMGFPDQGVGALDPEEEGNPDPGKPPRKATFLSFRSMVNGRPVATDLVRGRDEGEFWHTKMVSFAANQVQTVRDFYTQPIGGGLASLAGKTSAASQVGYVVHTGASWSKDIERSEIEVVFKTPAIKGWPELIPLRKVAKSGDGRSLDVPTIPKSAVVWSGPSTPSVSGNTVRFIRTHWRPKPSDDIQLTFGYR